jgi:lon-related putative ATP-dependent protease
MTLTLLTPGELYRRCDPEQFSFQTTEELPDLVEIIGQPRAIEAVRLGIGMQHEGYNIYALGPVGSGKRSLVMQFFEQRAKNEAIPPDWCYVYNFEHDYKPNAIQLPAGVGAQFQRDMAQLVEELRTAILAAFESDEYRARRRAVEGEFEERQEKAFQAIQQQAEKDNLTLMRTPGGIVFAPVREGQVIPPDEYQKLPEEDRTRMEKSVEGLQEQLRQMLQLIPAWQRELRTRLRDLNREITTLAIGGLMDEIYQKYVGVSEIPNYLEAVKKDVVENAGDFFPSEDGQSEEGSDAMATVASRARLTPPMHRYQVNLLVDNQELKGAPVIYEDNPTFQNLVGRVDHVAQMGALVTDFTLIKAGALHRANGGYLVLDVRKVLLQPYAWEGFKRALQSRQISIESLGQMLSLISTISLEPEPIKLNLKVALLGDRIVYYLLNELDPDFGELFKVQADFDETMPRNTDNHQLYASLIGTLARKEGLRPFDRTAVARVIEHSTRMAGDTEKLSIQMRNVINLLREANYWAGENGNHNIHATDVQKALDAQTYRADRVRQQLYENILRGTVLISTEGTTIGQVNGLSVLQLGDFSFGAPNRITARVSLGKGDVLNIEREVNLSGPIHSKGVLILAGFLRGRFATEKPFSLSASLVFEQSYSGVEGDSASSAELYALLSAITEVPLKQSLAVTGSIDQYGQMQAIGGVNEKIEGFFDICKARELNGEQGVLIPAANVKHLMLRQEVIDAVTAGKFHVYPVSHVDEGIEILTGVQAGKVDEQGNYSPETINGKVQARLAKLAEKREAAAKIAKESDKEGET